MIKRLRPLAAMLAGLILLGWGMGVLVLHVAHGFFHGNVDRPVHHWVHAHHSHALNVALLRLAHLGSDTVVLGVALVAGGIWAMWRRRLEPLLALALAYGGGAAIALVDKVAVRRGQSGLPGGLAGVTDLGFPSGHATLAAAVYGTMAVLLLRREWDGSEKTGAERDRPRWIVPAGLVLLALLIGVARVYNGQHDTTDVLAGWILGGFWAWTVGTSGLGRQRHHRGRDRSPRSFGGSDQGTRMCGPDALGVGPEGRASHPKEQHHEHPAQGPDQRRPRRFDARRWRPRRRRSQPCPAPPSTGPRPTPKAPPTRPT